MRSDGRKYFSKVDGERSKVYELGKSSERIIQHSLTWRDTFKVCRPTIETIFPTFYDSDVVFCEWNLRLTLRAQNIIVA